VERALAAARAHTDFVVGFICQENVLAKNPEESASFLYCTPGVRIGRNHHVIIVTIPSLSLTAHDTHYTQGRRVMGSARPTARRRWSS
jgi:hypothetical protein